MSDAAKIRACFEGWGETIMRLRPNFPESVREKVVTLKRLGIVPRESSGDKPGAGRALDIGCGSAPWAAAMQELGFDTVGIDFAPAMIAIASRNVPEVTFRCEDFLKAGFDGDAFDLIVAGGNQVTYYRDIGRFIARCAALLSPEGLLVVACSDFRATLHHGSSAQLLTHTRHGNGRETVVVDYRRIVEGNRAESRFWIMDETGAQWAHEYPATLHTLSEIREAMRKAGLDPSLARQQHETGYFYPIITARGVRNA